MWHLEAASRSPASAGLILFRSYPGSPLYRFVTISQDDLLFFEVDQIFVVVEDLYVGECSPCILYLLCCYGLFGFLSYFALSFLVASPSPLDLNGCNMVHRKPMVFE